MYTVVFEYTTSTSSTWKIGVWTIFGAETRRWRCRWLCRASTRSAVALAGGGALKALEKHTGGGGGSGGTGGRNAGLPADGASVAERAALADTGASAQRAAGFIGTGDLADAVRCAATVAAQPQTIHTVGRQTVSVQAPRSPAAARRTGAADWLLPCVCEHELLDLAGGVCLRDVSTATSYRVPKSAGVICSGPCHSMDTENDT
eukprot:COSAG02_NODE_569_length_20206_cov_5.631223_13_plen_204_part_00